METGRRTLFEEIYRETNRGIANRDTTELLTGFINKLKEILYQGQCIIETLTETK